MTVGFGLLGAGRIGQIHGRNIAASKRARLAGIADPVVDALVQKAIDGKGLIP